ncbi:MAG: translation initiation factor IF-1 [Bryobacteraceae bacterium]
MVEGEVVDLLPNATVTVKAGGRIVLAHFAGAASGANFVRLRPGDRVKVAVSPHDPGRGRVVELLKG